MTPRISSTNDAWLYTFVLQPLLEGVERMNRVWSGVDPRTFEPTVLSWKDRLIYLISGIALMIPLLSSIVWIFMQTFGNPEHLSNPYHAEIDHIV